MTPAILLSKVLAAARPFGATVLAATPGRIVARGNGVWIQSESPQVVDSFRCQNVPQLAAFLKGLRGHIDVSQAERTVLVAQGRELEVRPLTTLLWDGRSDPTFSVCVSRPALKQAVDRFARKDGACLLHYTHDALYLDDEAGSSSISNRRRSAGPVCVARAVSGQLLRRVAMTLRTDNLEMRILGEWNGAGPVVMSESEVVGGSRLTIVVAGDSYTRVRHLSLRAHARQKPEQSIYTGLTEQECEEVAASEERERATAWVETRQWDLHRLHEMAEDVDRREEQAELIEHLEWEARKHRGGFSDGCGLADCDVCVNRVDVPAC